MSSSIMLHCVCPLDHKTKVSGIVVRDLGRSGWSVNVRISGTDLTLFFSIQEQAEAVAEGFRKAKAVAPSSSQAEAA